MHRSGIESRPLAAAYSGCTPRVPLSQTESEVLDGLMLGDGCLALGKKARNAVLAVTRSATDLEYQDWIAEVFRGRLTPRGVAVRDVYDSRTDKTYQSAVLRTRSDPVFTESRLRWYPQGVKRIPSDISLATLAIAVWLADDGCVRAVSRRSPDIKFATHGFSELEVDRLTSLLTERYGKARYYRESKLSTQCTIRIWGAAARSLLRDVDPVFPPLDRKSQIWRQRAEFTSEKLPAPPCPRCGNEHVYRFSKTRKGVQKYQCQGCCRAFLEEYERPGRDPRSSLKDGFSGERNA